MSIEHGSNQYREVKIYRSNGAVKTWKELLSLYQPEGALTQGSLAWKNANQIKLTLDEDSYTYSLNHATSTPFADLINTFNSSALGAAAKLVEAGKAATGRAPSTFNPWFKNMKAWSNPEPLALPLRFSFKLGQFGLWDAREEVALPLLALMIPALSSTVGNYTMRGPFQSATNLLAKIVANSAKLVVQDLTGAFVGNSSISSAAAEISNVALGEAKNSTYKIEIGNQFMLDYAYCTGADVTMSSATDQDGFPISGSIAMKFEGTVPPAYTSTIVAGGSTRFYTDVASRATGSPSLPPGGHQVLGATKVTDEDRRR